jgi:multidrug efflux system membrane fusion protein
MVLIAVVPALAACGGGAGDAKGGAVRGARAFPVEVAPVATRDLDYAIEAVGGLEAEEEGPVVARVPGVVDKVFFQEADVVTPETVLAEIDTSRFALAAARSRALLARADADLKEALSAYDRRKALREKDPGWVSEEELSSRAASVERAKAALSEAKAALDLAEQDAKDSRVRSPKAGTINVKSVATGQFVERGRPVAQLIDPRRLRLRFRLTEAESVRVKPDSATTFRTRSYAGRDFPAKIYHVSTQADALTRMVDVLAWVDNAEGALKPGFFAEVRVKVASHAGAPVVPEGAVLPTEQGLVAFVVEGKTARQRLPQLGLHTADGMVEVLGGLRPGEMLVVRGAHSLKDGAAVEVVTPGAKGKAKDDGGAAPGPGKRGPTP